MKNPIAAQIQKLETEQLRSTSAQRLIEKISFLKNRWEPSRKRWFWELMQNASDYNDNVKIQLIVNNKQVVFKHDGLPFICNDVFNLIRPDSNKKDDIRRTDCIGKFGSGFVSTHILSSHIRISGLLQIKEHDIQKFEVDLNRNNYNNKKLLINDIKTSIDQFSNSIRTTSNTQGFCTSFTYFLEEHLPEIREIEGKDIDLEYLYRVLPYTLCFMPKIISIEITDNRNKQKKFKITRAAKSDDNSIIFNVSKDKSVIEEYTMLLYKKNDVSSCIRIKNNTIMPLPKDISKLFCGLPLIGTERTGLPFIVNSLQFEPTTEREGVEIDPSCDQQNIQILEDSIDLYDTMLDYIEDNEILDGYEIVELNTEYNGTYESKEYFKDHFVEKIKDIIFEHKIAQNNNNEFIKISDLRIPTNKELYGFAKKLVSEELPKKYAGWKKSLKFFDDISYTYENLANDIENQNLIVTDKETRAWLKDCLVFLIKNDKNICSAYDILPNQLGELRGEFSLYCDKSLPAKLKDINNKTEGSDKLASQLLHRHFNSVITLREYTRKDLANRIDDNLKELYADNDSQMPEEYASCINSLYEWAKECNETEDTLLSFFPWFYLKRASLIADMMTEEERNQSLIIARSGKMKILSALAESDLTNEDIILITGNIDKIRYFLSDKIDDTTYADPTTGEWGESIVWEKLQKKYPTNKGYKVIWASREEDEARYDFRIEKNNKIVCYYDAKTTSRGVCNADSIPFFMRKSQWDFLNQIKAQTPYFIARVFVADNNEVRFMKICVE